MENNLIFNETLTVEQFKNQMMVSKVEVKKNPHTGKFFFTYGAKTGMVAAKGIPKNPMFSNVSGTDRVTGKPFTCWLLHEEGNGGAPTVATF
jgi:hypothetical protein